MTHALDRRHFLALSAGGAAALMTHGAQAKKPKPAQEPAAPNSVKATRPLGNTGLSASDVGFGAGNPAGGPALIAEAVARGVNYFDTAPDYSGSEDTIGAAIKKDPALRKKMIITTKLCREGSYPKHNSVDMPVAKIIAGVEGSLKRLHTDYLDFLLVHAIGERGPGDIERLKDGNTIEAFAKLKKDGKIRFSGVSSHGPHKMADCLNHAVESGHFNLIMPAFNFMKAKTGIEPIIKKAGEKGVAVVAMKTMAGVNKIPAEKQKKLAKGTAGIHEPAFKYIWNFKEIGGLVITIKTKDQLDTYLSASGKKLTLWDEIELDRLRYAMTGGYCRTGCGECAGACPHGTEIAEVMRYDMYFAAYGEDRHARAEYAAMPAGTRADHCASCDGTPCAAACVHGLPIHTKLTLAHTRLA